MKLKKAHIDGFGCLENQDFYFEDDGLSVFQEPNGFGKTTMSIFIKSMFYGLVGNSRSIEGNERRKYQPWHGGAFGGYLIFEHKGEEYRVTRAFGSVKGKDRVDLVYERTGKRVTSVDAGSSSEGLGVEFFGLDADSFEKSVFLPQGNALSEFSTSKISEKLTGMIEQAGSAEGYEGAIERIKKARKELKPYRGTGGKEEFVSSRMTQVEKEMSEKKQDEILLAALKEKIEGKRQDLFNLRMQIEEIRSDIQKASSADAVKAFVDRRNELVKRMGELQKRIEAQEVKFPKRIPTEEEVNQLLNLSQRWSVLIEGVQDRSYLDDANRTLDELGCFFAQGVPLEEELKKKIEEGENLKAYERRLGKSLLSDDEEERLSYLGSRFPRGLPSESEFARIQECMSERISIKRDIESADNENKIAAKRVEELKNFFGDRIPSGDALAEMERLLDDTDAFRRRSIERLTQPNPQEEDRPRSKKGTTSLLMALGVSLVILAGVLLCLAVPIAAAVVCGVGAIVCFGAAFVLFRRVSQQPLSSVASGRDKEEAERYAAEADRLTDDVKRFVERYYSDGRQLRGALASLRERVSELEGLSEKCERRTKGIEEAEGELEKLETFTRSFLGGYISEEDSFEGALSKMQADAAEYRLLQDKRTKQAEAQEELAPEINKVADGLRVYLRDYGREVSCGGDYAAEIEALGRDALAYQKACDVVRGHEKVEEEKKRQISEIQGSAFAILEQCGLPKSLSNDSLLDIRDGRKNLCDLEEELAQAKDEMTSFLASNSDVAEMAEAELNVAQDASLAKLADEEKKLLEKLDVCRQELSKMHEEERVLSQHVSELVALEDELVDVREALREIRDRVCILDETESMLKEAKESLSRKYLGPVTAAFEKYSQSLFGDSSSFRVDEGMKVTIERKGAFKEAGYLSAGMADMVGVCMRMALGDALFEEEDSFIFLDDPFVNLDDEYLDRALRLLSSVAEGKQIVYLTCHTSRVPD
ncbi:AAA family ATPase [Adlercreutzia aquisgranensis]|uniref:AAA family ATPase n=1 Tax=Adlercreutzia aquisgranensis TaxID=2941323 RepID=UPI00203C4FFF|nr:AAA family ATPase [Adlercreutzia aquisgranensis]